MGRAVIAAAALAAALTTYAPVVAHDSRETATLAAVGGGRPAVYARAVPRRSESGAWLQYWFFYERQDQDRGIVRSRRHAGDWEMVQLRVDADGRPVEAVYAQHRGAERCGWGSVRRRGDRPVVFVANGSHASYLRPGTRDRLWPDPNDEADGRGAVVIPRVVPISRDSPGWMRFGGHWGGARAHWWIPPEQDSPRGPAFQPERWDDPDAWARAARPCQADCDTVDECDTAETALAWGGIVVGGSAWLSLRGCSFDGDDVGEPRLRPAQRRCDHNLEAPG